MSQFADEREAREFAVLLIVSEADRERVPLSEVERQMLYFSETGWTVPGLAEAAERFESEYDSAQYEKKIVAVIKRLQSRLKSNDPNTLKAWSDALAKLSGGDHYLLALARLDSTSPRPRHDFLKLCATALLIVLVGLGLVALLPGHAAAGPLSGEKRAFVIWLIAIIAASAFVLLELILGRERTGDLVEKWVARIFGDDAKKR